MSAERPRRSIRVPAKFQDKPVEDTPTASSSSSNKRKAPAGNDDPTAIDFVLTNPKSPLVNLELSKLINENTWTALSQDSRALLSTLLPPTVFPFFKPSLNPHHPANKQRIEEGVDSNPLDIDAMALASEPDLSFLTDPFFEAGAKTFQDHLYSGWLTPAHEALVREYTENLRNGKAHAQWKDDTWAEEHPTSIRNFSVYDGPAGDTSSIMLQDLTKHSILRVGDVLAYRRHFSQLDRTVAKDILIDSIQPSLTVLVAPSTRTHLPANYLEHSVIAKRTSPEELEPLLRVMVINNPSQLENALLDIDATIEKSKRPNGNAWKAFGVWRWRDGEIPDMSTYAEDSEEVKRGGREYRGTLFYLRGCFYEHL